MIGASLGFSIFVWILSLVKKDSIMLKFALPWIGLSLFSIVFSLSSDFAIWLTKLFGFEKPSNVYLTISVVSLITLGILLSIEVTKSIKRLEQAASSIALVEGRINSKHD